MLKYKWLIIISSVMNAQSDTEMKGFSLHKLCWRFSWYG